MDIVKKFVVFGNVQGVMFRRTFVQAAVKRKLKAGASNHPNQRDQVSCYLEGEESAIQEIIDYLKSGKKINSWGGCVTTLEEMEEGPELEAYQVNSQNCEDFHWSGGVEMFL